MFSVLLTFSNVVLVKLFVHYFNNPFLFLLFYDTNDAHTHIQYQARLQLKTSKSRERDEEETRNAQNTNKF